MIFSLPAPHQPDDHLRPQISGNYIVMHSLASFLGSNPLPPHTHTYTVLQAAKAKAWESKAISPQRPPGEMLIMVLFISLEAAKCSSSVGPYQVLQRHWETSDIQVCSQPQPNVCLCPLVALVRQCHCIVSQESLPLSQSCRSPGAPHPQYQE